MSAARITRWLSFTLVGVAAIFAAVYAARPITTWDFWWHVRAGEEIVRTRAIPTTDPFSHTAGLRVWVNHEWLFDAILYLIWTPLGAWPIRIACALLAGCTVLIVAWIAHRWTRSAPLSALIAIAFLGLYFGNIQARPQTLSTPLMLLVFQWSLFRNDPPGRPAMKTLIVFAVFMIVWSNLHSVALLPAVFYTIYLASDAASRLAAPRLGIIAPPPPSRLPWSAQIATWAVMLGGTFLNLNGWRLHEYAVKGTSLSATFISEWLPFRLNYAENRDLPVVIYAVVLATIAIYALYLTAHAWLRVKLDAPELALAVAFFYFALTARRWLWLAFLPLTFALREGSPLRRLAGSFVAERKTPAPAGKRDGAASRRRHARESEAPGERTSSTWRPAAAGAATLGLAAVLAQPLTQFRPARQTWETLRSGAYWKQPFNPDMVPMDAVSVIKGAGLSGNLYNYYGWGGFLVYSLYPQCRVFWDGRAVIFGEQAIKDASAIWSHSAGAALLLHQYDVDLTVMPETWEPPASRSGEWVPVFRNASSAVYAQAGSKNVAKAASWYTEQRIPFDPRDGFIEGAVLEADPDWARSRRLFPDELLSVVDPLYEVVRTDRWKRSGSQAPFRVRIAEAFAKAGYTASAARELEEAHRLDPDDRFTVLNLANVELNRGRAGAAARVLDDFLLRHPDDAQARALRERARQRP
jgi:tetratricopeptide (TPR) repeat protein